MAPSRRSYAVVWQEPDGVSQPGRVTLAPTSLRFEGGRGRLSARTLAYADLAAARMGAFAERVGGRPTLVLERRHGQEPMRVAAVGGAGALAELLERITPNVPQASDR